MHYNDICRLFVWCLLFFPSLGSACDYNELKARNELNKIIQILNDNDFYRIDVFHVPENMTSFLTIDAEHLEKYSHGNTYISMSNVNFSRRILSLKDAFSNTEMYPAYGEHSLHWGAAFYDEDGKRLAAFHVERTFGSINGFCVGLNDVLSNWFVNNFYPK